MENGQQVVKLILLNLEVFEISWKIHVLEISRKIRDWKFLGNDASYSPGGCNQFGSTLHWGPYYAEGIVTWALLIKPKILFLYYFLTYIYMIYNISFYIFFILNF